MLQSKCYCMVNISQGFSICNSFAHEGFEKDCSSILHRGFMEPSPGHETGLLKRFLIYIIFGLIAAFPIYINAFHMNFVCTEAVNMTFVICMPFTQKVFFLNS